MLAFSVPTAALFGAGKLNELHTQINTPMGAVHGTKALVVISSGKFTRANGDLGQLAAEAGVHVDYIASIQMVDNYLPVFDMDEQMSLDKHVEEQLTAAVQAVSRRERGISEATEEGRKLHAQVAAMNREQPAFNDGSQITVLDSCIGCGVCQSVCPVGNFYLEGGKAKRKQSTCEFCLACAQNCPQKAIGLSMADKNPHARYRNPHISLQEIIDANRNL